MTGPLMLVGADGQVGREVRALLAPTDHALSRQGLDVTDAAQVAATVKALKPRAVINTSAYTAVDRAEDEADAAFSVNRDGPANLAKACDAAGIPFLHLSTDYVFDGSKQGTWIESDSVRPLNVYGESKLEGERRIAELCGRHLIIRTAWVFSSFGANFVKTMSRLAHERDQLNVVDDQTGSPTAASDIAQTLMLLASKATATELPWGIYHYAGAPSTTWCGFAQAIVEEIGDRLPSPCVVRGIPSADYPTRAARPRNSILDCSKIHTAFGIQQPDWRAALNKTIAILEVERTT